MIDINNLSPDARISIQALKEMFPNWESKELVDTFIYQYNKAKEVTK